MSISYCIIALTVGTSIYTFSNAQIFDKLAFYPYLIKRRPSESFRFISHGFIHGDYGHLLFNMVTLYFFGPLVEESIMSKTEFTLFYLSSMILASSAAYQTNQDNQDYRACGASGAISAILFVLVFYEPWSVLYISFFIPIYYILFAIGFLMYSWYMDKKSTGRIAHDTHLYGALVGIAYTLLFHPESLSIFLQKIKHLPF